MTDKEKAALFALGAVAAVSVFCMRTSGNHPDLTLKAKSVGNSYDPYIHWTHGGGGSWVHCYPTVIGATCLGQAIQSEDIGLAMKGVDVSGCGGYPQ